MDETVFQILWIYLILINIVTFIVYGIDKYKARHHHFRIPEITLIAFAYLGGAYGAILGMKVWHHKTRKWKFRIAVPLAAVLVTVLIVYFSVVIGAET